MRPIKPDDELVLRRYLLGQLTGDEQIRIEQEFFSDNDAYEQLLAIEDELRYDYIQGALGTDEYERFKGRFLATEDARKKLETARQILRRLDESRGTVESFRVTRVKPRPVWFLPVVAAACIAMVVISSWLLFRASRFAVIGTTASTPQLSAPPEGTPVPAPVRRTPVVITLMLSPSLTRDAQEQVRVTVPPDADTLRLQLELPRNASYSRYRAVLETAEGKEILRDEAAQSQPGAAVVTIDIPVDRVIKADYLLSLSGAAANGAARNVADYSFRVLR